MPNVDPDVLPGQPPAATDNLDQIRKAAQTKKAVLQARRLERQVQQDEQPKEPRGGKIPYINKNVSLDELLKYWAAVDEKHPKRFLAYLYRWFPRIIKPKPHYIEIYEKPITREELLGVWGAGEYELKLNDKDRRGAVCTATFEFAEPWDKNPPNVNPTELDYSHKRNASYLQWRESRGMDTQKNNPAGDASAAVLAKALVDVVNAKTQQPANNTAEATALKSAMDLMGEATKQAISTVKAQQDPAGVSGMLTALEKFVRPPQQTDPLEMLKNAKEIFGAGNSNDRLVELLLKLQSDNSRALAEAQSKNLELLMKMMEEKKDSSDPLSQVTKLSEVINAVRDLSGEGGGGGRSGGKWWQELIGAAVAPGGAFSSLLGPVATWGLAKLSGWKPGQAAPGAPPPPGPTVQPPPAGLPVGLPTNPAAAAPAVDPQEQFMMDNLMNTFAVISGPLMTFLKQGRHGDELADYLFEGGTIDMVQMNAIRQVGRDKIMAMLKGNQMAWQAIGPIEQQFVTFLDEFLAWQPEQEGQEAA